MSSPLRVLYAIPENHPTHRPDVSVLFGVSLPAHGVTVDLLATAHGDAEVPKWRGGDQFIHRARGRLGLMLADVWQQFTLFWRVRAGYDALVVRDKPVLGLLGLAAAKLAGVPFVYWMSFPLPEQYLLIASRDDGSVGALRRLWLQLRGRLGLAVLERLLIPHSDWLFVQSDAMEAELRRGPLRHDRVTPVPMGVDVEAVPAPAERLPELVSSGPFGIYMGTLDRSRRPELLVDTALKVAEQVPGFRMLIVGDVDTPADRGWVQHYAESRNAGHCVHFTGRLPSREALALARRADVGLSIMPRDALTETASPTKVVEYLACSLPVVCNDQPDHEYVMAQSGGGRVTALDAREFAEAIIETLKDGPAARARAVAARTWIERHRSYGVLGRLVADTLAAMVASRQPGRADRVRTGP
jgi:glycosyltransferase involved in cell wall biosynthesis